MKTSVYSVAFGLIGLFAVGCSAAGSDSADDSAIAAQDAELLAVNAEEAGGTELGAHSSDGVAAAPSCTATTDGGKWCCAPDASGQLKCWKVDPPPPPDTIATRALLKANVLRP